MTAKNNRNFDVAFIQVDRPFTGVTSFKFVDTPLSGTSTIGVVGYPGDLKDEKTKEVGAHMYEMFLSTNYNLAESQWRMLEYQIDTYGGESRRHECSHSGEARRADEFYRQLGVPCASGARPRLYRRPRLRW